MDEYRDCIMSLVERKARGEEIHVQHITDRKSEKAADLMSALEASLAAATKKQRSGRHGHNGEHRRRKSA